MRRSIGTVIVSAVIAAVAASCGGSPGDGSVGLAKTPTSSASASAKESPRATAAPLITPTYKSEGRMVLLDVLSIPKMEGWEYFSPEEGEADGNSLTDAFYDAEGCSAKALKVYQCPKAVVNDDAATSKIAEEAKIGNPFKGMHRDVVARYVLCSIDPSKKGVKPLKPGTDNIDGVTAYRYRVNFKKDCGMNFKPIPHADPNFPQVDPNFNGGTTLWFIKKGKVEISIRTVDSGAKGMVGYADIGKFRYALTHGKWLN